MKILFVCHRFPFPPKRGGKIRPFNIIRHLSERHEVTVASLARTRGEAAAGAGLGEHCRKYLLEVVSNPSALWNMARRLPTRVPFSMGYFYSGALKRRIQEELSREAYNLILVHCSSVAQYVEDVQGIPKLLDFGDMDSQKWLIYGERRRPPANWVYRTEGVRLERAEKELAAKFGYCTCTTRAEMETLESYGVSGHRTGWFPNGVDFEYFLPAAEPCEPDTLCFIGRMDYYPNQECMFDFCANTLPLIREARPGVRLDIVGADPSPAVRRLGGLPGVTVTGSVPDVRPHVQHCAVNVAPLNIARGTQNKILESLAMGVPVVSSGCAATGVDAVPGEHFLVADDHRGFADAVVRLLGDPGERQRFAEAGRQRMLTHHSWERSMGLLDEVIEDCLSFHGDRGGPAGDAGPGRG